MLDTGSETWDLHGVKSRWLQVVQRTTEALGCSAEVNFFEDVHPYYPPTVNNPEAYAFAMDVGEQYAPPAHHRLVFWHFCCYM